MAIRVTYFLASAVLTTGLLGAALTSVDAQTARQQCGAKYKAAKAANTLNGQTYNQFYSACSKELKGEAAAPAAPATTAAPAAVPANPLKPATPATTTTSVAPSAPAPTAPVATGSAVFPTAISPKYANEKPGAARFKTCDEQYQLNKPTNGNGGLKWIMKGGGYYSQCNKRLKS